MLAAALLACGGGSSTECEATITHQGKQASAKGGDRIAARHSACRSWCEANDSTVASAQAGKRARRTAECAANCGAEVMFSGSATVSCD